MSIPRADILAMHHPQEGIRKPRVEATLRLTQSVPLLETRTPDPQQQLDVAKQRIIDRLYGDIAHDFEAFLQLLDAGESPNLPGRAMDLRDQIRAKLRGDGPTHAHSAPAPGYPVQS